MAAKKKERVLDENPTKLPKNFSPYGEPKFYYSKPLEIYPDVCVEVERTDLGSEWEIDISELDPNYNYKIEGDTDYGGCYYSGDTPSVVLQLVKYTRQNSPNHYYKQELKNYEKNKEEHQFKLKQWKIYKKLWDELKAKEQEAKDKAEYKRLKKKYEGSI